MNLSPDDIQLSVVVVTYNEEDNVESCLDSVFEYTTPYLSEVIVVDSNSTDRTVDIASEYPITLLQITDDRYTSPSAGRYVGTHYAHGDFVLFVDGDLTVTSNWLEPAFKEFENREDVGGVSGHLGSRAGNDRPTDVDAIKAVMLFRMDVLEDVGTFHPFVNGAEDYELSYRVRNGGYTLRRLPHVVAHHPEHDHSTEAVRRLSNKYLYGLGQVLRLHSTSTKFVASRLWKIRKQAAVFLWVIIGIPLLVIPAAFVIWLTLSTIGFLLIGLKAGFTRVLNYVLQSTLFVVLSLIAFVRGVPEREEFSMDVINVIKRETYEGAG